MSHQLQLTTDRVLRLRAFEASYVPSGWTVSLFNHIQARARKREETMLTMDCSHVEALAAFQGYACAISGVNFVLPDAVDQKKYGAYTKWLNSLEDIDRQRAAMLVRAYVDRPWAPGNLILLSYAWAQVYEQQGTIIRFHDMMLEVMSRIRDHRFTIMRNEDYNDAMLRLAEIRGG